VTGRVVRRYPGEAGQDSPWPEEDDYNYDEDYDGGGGVGEKG
jgi:hypothetical protein